MDAIEHSALAKVCGTHAPTFPSAEAQGEIFGRTAWGIVEGCELGGYFECVRAFGSEGSHFPEVLTGKTIKAKASTCHIGRNRRNLTLD